MRDYLYFIYYSIMGVVGFILYLFMFIGIMLYFPIWKMKQKDKKTEFPYIW